MSQTTWATLIRKRAVEAARRHLRERPGQPLMMDGWDMIEYRAICHDLRMPLSYQAALWPAFRRRLGALITAESQPNL